MDQAVKYEMSHFGGERRPGRERPEREQHFRGPPRPNLSQTKKSFHKRSYKPGHYAPAEQTKNVPVNLAISSATATSSRMNRETKPTPAEEGPDVASASKQDLTVNEATLNLFCDDPLVYNRAPLFSIVGDVRQCEQTFKTNFLLDCGATTVYLSRDFVRRNDLKSHVYSERTIKVKLGDNKIGESVLELIKIEVRLQNTPNYQCVAVVFDIPEEFDCVLGMPFFVDVQPDIDWKRRCFKKDVSDGASTIKSSTPCGKRSQVNGSGLHDAVDSESPSALSSDSCGAAIPETQAECEAEVVKRPNEDVETLSRREKKNVKAEAMFTLGVVDSEGVETKYITRKKLQKFMRLPAKDAPEHDFMILLTNDTIKRIGEDLNRNDEPNNVSSEKAKRFLNPDWESFKNNPAYAVLIEYKDNVFKPDLPDGLPMERRIEHRIDVKDPNVAMYRQRWRLSPEQKAEIDKWVREMIAKGLIRPSISRHAAPTFCVRKPVGWRIVHDYRYLNSNTVRQSVPMTRKEDVFDSMAGAYYFSCKDLMSAYYQVRMKLDHVKYTAFQAPSGL
ncbi:Hypothetical protein PHPALM_56 [Phytophthora palmivora]|uniref:Reverse transcriptase n=1 Tax=Phytophthora palmivora TaxID=4796 RepID=A0A2P4YVU3_9STRA|nr:Hypothetical protein PHPALM_56 [Phytophthora palmivora]